MSKKISKDNLKPVWTEFDTLYSKYRLLCSIDYHTFLETEKYNKTMCYFAFEIIKILENDFESVFHELKTLERYIADEDESK